jgi:transposase InsO family protein
MFTAPGNPQQNGKEERSFATLLGKTRSILKAVKITIPFRKGLRVNCANLSVQLENITVEEKDQQSADKVYGINPKWISMRNFGEMANIDTQTRKSETR